MKNLAKFLAVAALAAGVATAHAANTEKTSSGLEITMLKEGSGKQPSPASSVTVNYRGTLTNGKEFDSSYARNEPITFPLNGVIKCWQEGVGKMKEGGKAKLVCPANIAYGSQAVGGVIPPNSTLIFEVELLKVD